MTSRTITITPPSEHEAFAHLIREAARLFDVHLVNLILAAALVLLLAVITCKSKLWSA